MHVSSIIEESNLNGSLEQGRLIMTKGRRAISQTGVLENEYEYMGRGGIFQEIRNETEPWARSQSNTEEGQQSRQQDLRAFDRGSEPCRLWRQQSDGGQREGHSRKKQQHCPERGRNTAVLNTSQSVCLEPGDGLEDEVGEEGKDQGMTEGCCLLACFLAI